MKPFQKADLPPEYRSPQAYMNSFKVDYMEACRMVRIAQRGQIYVNDQYQVNVSPAFLPPGQMRSFIPGQFDPVQVTWPGMVHLSIKRIDKAPIHDWRDLQTIKNLLVGPECEAIEIYPAESRLVDMAHQYHLWCFIDPEVRIPTGWNTRMVCDEVHAEKFGTKQRPIRSLEELQPNDDQKP